MTNHPSRLSRETRQAMINVALTGGVACALTWGALNAVGIANLRADMPSETKATSELVEPVAHVAEDVTPHVRVVTREVPVEVVREVEVPVTVTETVEVPDPTAYDRGYADARAEFETPDDYFEDWWEDGRDAGYSQAIAEASKLGGMVDPANIMAALSTPCEQEDSVNCYWRADIMGNGEGESFVNIEGHIFPLASLLGGE